MASRTVSLTIVWFVLVGATLFAWFMGQHSNGTVGRLAPQVAAGILIVAFGKVGLVMAYFMELRWAPYALIAAAVVWVAVSCSILLWLFAS